MPVRPLTLALVIALVACASHAPPAPSAPPPVTVPPPPAVTAAPPTPPPFDPAPWLADFEALRAELSSHYANLDWAVDERKMDLPALRAKTEGRIQAAHNEAEARSALDSFVRAFGDAHLEIEWSRAPEHEEVHDGPLCERFSGHVKAKPGVDFALAGDFTPNSDGDSADFPGGVLRLKNGKTLGTIRIGLFMEQIHPALCEEARKELALANDAACDDACTDRLAMRIADKMTAALVRRARSLAHRGVSALVIDLTSNGGGSSWMEPAERVLTPVPLVAPRMGFLRHPHWAKKFERDLAAVDEDRKTRHDPVLDAAAATLHAALDDTRTPCDRTALWTAGAPRPTCRQLVTNRIYTSGLLPYAKPGSFEGWASHDALYEPREYAYTAGEVSLPLVVLVDENTASASEQFVSMLGDNHAALIMGTLTLGCGCGFTDGGIPTTLPRSGASVRIPNCARMRADGRNEVSGYTPDVLLPLAMRDSPYQRAVKVVAGLETNAKRIVETKVSPSAPRPAP